jgi:alpha-tubulin suppressor-like RCC1 family protein
VQGAGAAWQSAELADDHACGHTTDGKTWCWGSNVYGELADPALDALRMRTYATQVAGDFEGGFTGLGHECFIARDTHTMSCVGRGGGGQLGDGTAGSRRLPVHVADDLANVSAGSYATCAVSSAGALTCWGSDHEGILGDGQVTPIDLQTPTTIAPAITWQQVSLADHACGLDDTQTIYCWGSNANGQLGDGTLLERHAPTPLSVPTGWTAVTSGINHSCGLGTDGGLWCWGLNTAGECGQPWATLGGTDVVLAATRVGTGQWSTAAAGSAFTCAVDGSAQLQCFGYDALGALGDTMSASRYLPAPTVPPISGKVVTAGANVGCGIDMTGKLACWGYDPEGEIGDGTTTSHGGPTAVVVPPTWHSVSTGFQHTCGITTDNALYCWGKNYYGETGSGDFEEHHDPHQVGTDTDWAAVTTGYTHTCALKTDHSLWCWGDDRDGELGDGAAWRSTLGVVP